MTDTEALGNLVANVMGELADRPDGAFVRTVAIVVELDCGDTTEILAATSEDRPWASIEFLRQGIVTLEDQVDAMREEQDDS